MANDLYVEEAITRFQKEWHDVLGKVSPKVARQLKNTLKIHVSNMRSFLRI